MKAISLHAPWGTLLHTPNPCDCPMSRAPVYLPTTQPTDHMAHCAYRRSSFVKRFETRSWPCPPSIIGQRIAIHQAKKRPNDVWVSANEDRVFPAPLDFLYDRDMCVDPQESADGEWWRYRWAGPLGCIVASGVITRSLPIVEDAFGQWFSAMDRVKGTRAWLARSGDGLTLADMDVDGTKVDISDQLPYGDWSPGRWAWELADVAATTDRCPWCWGTAFWIGAPPICAVTPCRVCGGVGKSIGKCAPIPAQGHQRFWEWTP